MSFRNSAGFGGHEGQSQSQLLWLDDGSIIHDDDTADALRKAIWHLENETLCESNYLVIQANDAIDDDGSWYNT
jgi:hypothetical protein